MITEDYVSFEVAKLLNKKGFDSNISIPHAVYSLNDGTFINLLQFIGNTSFINYNLEKCVVAPTLQMACKWLKEIHNIFIAPTVGETDGKFWYDADIIPINGKVIYWKSLDVQLPMLEEDSPEKAIEKALKYCLEHLI